MAKRRTKSPKELKAEQERGRNFNVAEIDYIKANAPTMTVKQLADALKATEQEIESLIKQYNDANGSMIKQSYIVGKDKKRGVVVATQASSELGDEKNQGFIRPKQEVDYI